MPRSRQEIGELVAKLFDRLDAQFDGEVEINDALLLVELTDPGDVIELNDSTGREVPATIVALESTSDRLVIQAGIMEFARDTLMQAEDGDDD